ncbi:hypothetical protein [Mycobacterium sp.]|uniref:hypothetical protein n=1 Tax=Mycobacterium sp. TaxID=1785 RepID=UPI003A87C216
MEIKQINIIEDIIQNKVAKNYEIELIFKNLKEKNNYLKKIKLNNYIVNNQSETIKVLVPFSKLTKILNEKTFSLLKKEIIFSNKNIDDEEIKELQNKIKELERQIEPEMAIKVSKIEKLKNEYVSVYLEDRVNEANQIKLLKDLLDEEYDPKEIKAKINTIISTFEIDKIKKEKNRFIENEFKDTYLKIEWFDKEQTDIIYRVLKNKKLSDKQKQILFNPLMKSNYILLGVEIICTKKIKDEELINIYYEDINNINNLNERKLNYEEI